MKLRIIAIAICISLVLNLSGCKNKGTVTSPDVTTGAEENTGNGSVSSSDGTARDTGNQANNGNTSAADDRTENGGRSDAGNPSDNSDTAENGDPSSTDKTAKSKINDNGTPISDFDEYVNREWKLEQKAANKDRALAVDESRSLVNERLLDILNNTDISGLPEDDGFKKAITVYREIRDHNDISDALNTIRDFIAPIEKTRTLEDLYELYSTEKYSLFNLILRFEIGGDANGNNMQYLSPIDLSASINGTMFTQDGEEKSPEHTGFLAFANELGITEQRVNEIRDNSLIIGGILGEYPMGPNANTYYFSVEQLNEAGVKVPLFDILRKLNSLGPEEDILAGEKCCELLNKLYVPENAAMLRDYLLLYAMRIFYNVSGYISTCDIPDYDHETEICSLIQSVARDVLAAEYMNRYYPEDEAEELRKFISDIKDAAKAVIYEADWLSTYSAEAVRAKLMKMRVCAGKNGYSDDLKELELSGDYIEDFFRITLCRNHFAIKQLNLTGDYRRIFKGDLFDVNGFFYGPYYSYVLTAGLLCDPECLDAKTFEEKLATLGFIIAHEISHAFDPQFMTYDEYGYYNPRIKDEELRAHASKVDKIMYHYNGIETGYGRKITGARIINETYTDIMGMQICMKMLAEQEDPDYDLFFTTLAKRFTAYYSENGIDAALEDTHLPGNIRLNCILSQFDEFYDTYDIDENSPFYVPEDKRLKAF